MKKENAMIQKKYISPSIEIITMESNDGIMLTVSGEISTEPQLSGERNTDFSDEADWD